jgi:hypothetical protein
VKRLLIGLLKLVLQLIIFAVSGKWVRIGDLQPRQQQLKPRKVRSNQPARQASSPERGRMARRIFDVAQPPVPRGDEGEWFESDSPEEAGSHFEEELPSLEALIEEGADAFDKRRARRRRHAPPALPTGRPRSLAAAFRDRRAIRDAVVVGALVAARRRVR